MTEYGPTYKFSDWIHSEKYRGKGESFKQAMTRVADALKDDSLHYFQFRDILLNMRFLPGGRIQSAMGSPRQVTAMNCLSGDTQILTKEYGVVNISDVSGEYVTLLDGDNNWVNCKIYDHGLQFTVPLTFRGNFKTIKIRSTLNHDWVLANKFTKIKTDAFYKNKRKKCEIDGLSPKREILDTHTYKEGVIHGLIYGDGTFRKEKKSHNIRVCSNHNDIEYWLKDFNKSCPPSCGGDPVYYLPKSYKDYSLKTLPCTNNTDYLLGFIRGWFAADGCVSTNSSPTICGDIKEKNWLLKWGPLVGWVPMGHTKLAEVTNYGRRNKESLSIRISKSTLSGEDFLVTKHRNRFTPSKLGNSWRVSPGNGEPRLERVYCPVVPTTHSFSLGYGIHSGNCFVSPVIEDDMESIMEVAKVAAQTMRLGGGIGFDFSKLRPRGSLIKSLESRASGPVSFMHIYDAVCKTIASAGHRRGAMLAALRVDHPDIEEFVECKLNENALTQFNISVAVTDKFMEAVKNNTTFDLVFEDRVYKTVDAVNLWNKILRNTWSWAEPKFIWAL